MPISLCQWTPLQRAQLPAGYCCPLGSSPQPSLLRAEQSQPLSLSWCISCTKPTFTLAAQLWAPSTKTPPLLPRVTSPPGVPAASQLGQAEKHLLPAHRQCLPVTAQAAVGTRLAYGQPGVPRCTSAQLPLCWPAAGGWLFITRCQTLWFPFVRLLSELWMVSMLSPLNCGIVLPATQQRPHAGIATHI